MPRSSVGGVHFLHCSSIAFVRVVHGIRQRFVVFCNRGERWVYESTA